MQGSEMLEKSTCQPGHGAGGDGGLSAALDSQCLIPEPLVLIND